MRSTQLLVLAICFAAAPAYGQSCHSDSGFGGFSSYSTPSFSSFDSGPSFMTSSISYQPTQSFYSLGTTASVLAPTYSAPISGFYSAASSFYSQQPSYAPMGYSSAPMSYAPASYSPATYSAPAAMTAPLSNCANGNCSQSASLGGGWSFGF